MSGSGWEGAGLRVCICELVLWGGPEFGGVERIRDDGGRMAEFGRWMIEAGLGRRDSSGGLEEPVRAEGGRLSLEPVKFEGLCIWEAPAEILRGPLAKVVPVLGSELI